MQDYGAGEFQQGEVWGCRAALMPARKEEAIKEALKPSGMIWQMAEERQRKDGWTNASVCSFRTKNRLMRQYHIWSSHKYRKPAFWFPAVRIKAVQERNCTSHRWRTYAGIYLHPEKSSGHLPSNRQLHHKNISQAPRSVNKSLIIPYSIRSRSLYKIQVSSHPRWCRVVLYLGQ